MDETTNKTWSPFERRASIAWEQEMSRLAAEWEEHGLPSYEPECTAIGSRIAYAGECPETLYRIALVVSRLPDEVQTFVFTRCFFVSLSGLNGPVGLAAAPVRLPCDRPWVIGLRNSLPRADALGVIAHEIAHAWLGPNVPLAQIPSDSEARADEQAEAWGFAQTSTGPYPEAVF
jgi:hypothetical protein